MIDDAKNPEGAPEEGAPQGDEAFSAEGPDVETKLTDADEAFLQDVSAGDAPSAAEGAAPQALRQAQDGAEHLEDLRRLTAEYANYRRRVERERVVERERAVGDAARAILPALDDLDRAEAHGDLAEGPMTAIAQKLRAAVAKLGISAYGANGDLFDPREHDAIFQRENADVQRPTVSDVVERGYRIGDTTLRVAKVVVDTPSA